MSAFYSFVYPDRVQLLTDGASLDGDGNFLGTVSKVLIVPRLPIAITGRGVGTDMVAILQNMEAFIDATVQADSVDVMLMAMGWFFDQMKEQGNFFDVEFLVAAFSEDDGPCHRYVSCHQHNVVCAFEMLDLGPQICGGTANLGWDDIAHLNLDVDAVNAPDFPLRYGASIMSAIRRKKCRPPGMTWQLHTVGGRCDLTTVTAEGVMTRTLCTWDDEIGKPIDPEIGYSASPEVSA
jgi:hypothetical protein